MNIIKSLLMVSILSATGIASAATIQTYTVTYSSLAAIYVTSDSNGNPTTIGLPVSGGGTGTASLDSSGALTMNVSGELVVDESAVVEEGLAPGTLVLDQITSRTIVLFTTGAFTVNTSAGNHYSIASCNDGPLATTPTCTNYFGSGLFWSSFDNSRSFSLDGGVFDIKMGTNSEALVTSQYTLTAVPIPAGAWLIGSGLIGLTGLASKRKTV